MSVETATNISQLDATLPTASDAKSEGDDHIRLVKSTIKATFPSITGISTSATSNSATIMPTTSMVQDAIVYSGGINIHAATTKATPVDGDELCLTDSAASYALKKFTWSDLRTKLNFVQSGTGGTSRTFAQRAAEMLSVTEYGAVGDGSTDDATAFSNACASGAPVYVPKVATFYALTTLAEADRALLWGPGVVKVASVETPIAPFPSLTSTTQGVVNLKRTTHAPTNITTNGSVGLGISYTDVTRSGGYGQYGNVLSKYLVSAAVSSPQFDVGDTSWVTMTNLTGGQGFGRWTGANSPAVNLSQTYSSGAVIGDEINVGNRWADFGMQYDVGGTRYTVGQQIVPDVIPSADGTNTKTCTMSAGTPGLVNLTAHGFTANMGVVFGGGGTLPAALTAGTTYYVSATGLAADTFSVAATLGGTAINFAGASSGTVNVLPSYPGSFGQAMGASIWGHQWWVGTLIRNNTICAGGIAHIARGGSVAAGKPAFWLQLRDHWARGIDFTTATLADNIALQMSAGHAIYFGTASMSGSGTGSWSVSTGGTGNTGALYSDNYAAVNLRWSRSGGVATLGLYGATPVAQSTGYGTPVNGAKSASFDATTIVHLDLAKVVAQLIIDLKSLGVVAA